MTNREASVAQDLGFGSARPRGWQTAPAVRNVGPSAVDLACVASGFRGDPRSALHCQVSRLEAGRREPGWGNIGEALGQAVLSPLGSRVGRETLHP